MNEDIVRELQRRDVTHLLHFTSHANLIQMLQAEEPAIVPRSYLEADEKPELRFLSNDSVRLDGTDHINLSIQSCNKRLLYVFRKRDQVTNTQRNLPTQSWFIIAIKPEVLLTAPCRFTVTNAASRYADPREGIDGLNRLFADNAGYKLKDSQAECLFYGKIPYQYWMKIYAETEQEKANLDAAIMALNTPLPENSTDTTRELFT